MKWTTAELSYMAGIIDGEGCFCIQRPGGKTHTLRMFVMNTSKQLIDYLYKTYGGFQYSRKKENSTWKIRHEWFVDRYVIDELIPLLLPYLIVKKEHAQIAIEFRKTFPKVRGYRNIPKDLVSIREDCHRRMQVLNKKGP